MIRVVFFLLIIKSIDLHACFHAAHLKVRVWSRTPANAQRFAQEIGAKVFETPEQAVKDADVICTVTFATTPIVQQEWIKPGAHINGSRPCSHYDREASTVLQCTLLSCLVSVVH